MKSTAPPLCSLFCGVYIGKHDNELFSYTSQLKLKNCANCITFYYNAQNVFPRSVCLFCSFVPYVNDSHTVVLDWPHGRHPVSARTNNRFRLCIVSPQPVKCIEKLQSGSKK